MFIKLAENGVFIDIPHDDINDKSKATIIQKSLVLLQIAWMATQCITRKVYGLPLSLLEYHTMVHVISALSIYFFWMKLEFDHRPEMPSTLTDQDVIRNHLMCWYQKLSLRMTSMIISHYSF